MSGGGWGSGAGGVGVRERADVDSAPSVACDGAVLLVVRELLRLCRNLWT